MPVSCGAVDTCTGPERGFGLGFGSSSWSCASSTPLSSGLSAQLANWFVGISTQTTLPFFTFLSTGLLNMFIPSGGGQRAVPGSIMIPAALDLHASTAKTAMTVAWGMPGPT